MKTAFFDLGNVLIFFSHEKMCRQLADVLQTSYEKIYDLLFHQHIAKDYELGLIDSEEMYNRLSTSLKRRGDFLTFLQAASNIFEPNEAIYPIIEKLKKNGVRLTLLSNTNEAHFNYAYSHFPILRLFHDRILSYEVNLQKPDPAIFYKALTKAGSDNFYTDDLLENIQAAKKVGLDSEQFTSTQNLYTQLTGRGFL